MLKVGQFCTHKYGNTIIEIVKVSLGGYNVRYVACENTSFIGTHPIPTWRKEEFKQIAPEGFTLEEAKLYFAL